MKARVKREGPLRVDLAFDEAIVLALQVKPPSEGWSAVEGAGKHKRRRRHKTVGKK